MHPASTTALSPTAASPHSMVQHVPVSSSSSLQPDQQQVSVALAVFLLIGAAALVACAYLARLLGVKL